jgi:hypothetical protein
MLRRSAYSTTRTARLASTADRSSALGTGGMHFDEDVDCPALRQEFAFCSLADGEM